MLNLDAMNMNGPARDAKLRGAPKSDLPHVLIYNTAENQWAHFDSWPLACESGCAAPLKSSALKRLA